MFERKYGAATTVLFPLIERDGTDLTTAASHASGDSIVMKDEGTPASSANAFAHEGNGIYSIVLTATEMQAARIAITIIDQTDPKVWEDQVVVIDTYGHASAQHELDRDQSVNDIIDALLSRPISNVDGAAFRSLYGAVASLVNRVKINSQGDLEVYETDDATILETLAATSSDGHISEVDPP